MEQNEIIRLLENMLKGADQLADRAGERYAEANKPESDNYIIRDGIYSDLQYFKGYRQGISNVLNNIRTYYYEEEVKA